MRAAGSLLDPLTSEGRSALSRPAWPTVSDWPTKGLTVRLSCFDLNPPPVSSSTTSLSTPLSLANPPRSLHPSLLLFTQPPRATLSSTQKQPHDLLRRPRPSRARPFERCSCSSHGPGGQAGCLRCVLPSSSLLIHHLTHASLFISSHRLRLDERRHHGRRPRCS